MIGTGFHGAAVSPTASRLTRALLNLEAPVAVGPDPVPGVVPLSGNRWMTTDKVDFCKGSVACMARAYISLAGEVRGGFGEVSVVIPSPYSISIMANFDSTRNENVPLLTLHMSPGCCFEVVVLSSAEPVTRATTTA